MKHLLSIGLVGVVLASCQNTNKTETNNTVTESSSNGPSSIDLSYMDKTVRPQDDFFQFANGTWCKENPVPNSESRWGSFNELDKRNKTVIKGLLADAQKDNGVKGSDNQLVGDYYSSYTNMEKRNELGTKPIAGKLIKIDAIKSKDDLIKTLAELHKYGVNALFGFGVGQDLKNVDGNISYFGQGGLGLPNKDFYFKDNKKEIRDKYVTYIKDVLVLSGNNEAYATEAAKKIFAFESDLASAMMAPEELRSPEKTYNKMAYKDFLKETNNADMELYFSTV